MRQIVAQLLLTIVLAGHGNLVVEIITPGAYSLEYLGSLSYVGPAIQLALEHLNETYFNAFTIHHNYLIYDVHLTCVTQAYFISDMLAKFYYRKKQRSSLTVVIFSGKSSKNLFPIA